MIFHRLAVDRIIAYLGLTNLFGGKKKPVNTEIRLKVNDKMNMTVSVLMSILGTLICLTLPFAVLEKPLEILSNNWPQIRSIMEWVEYNMEFLDRVIIATTIVLVYVAASTILDAVKNTNIKVSPWVQKGKYLPRKYNVKLAKSLRCNQTSHGY